MKRTLPHIKKTHAKGRVYLYFRTGALDAKGGEVLVRLPAMNDPGFGGSYASCLAGRSRRANAATILTVLDLIELYEKSPKYLSLSPGSRKIYGISLRYFQKMLAPAPAGLLERIDIAKLIDGRADQPGAANSLLRTINALYKWARERGHATNDPGRDVPELPTGEHAPWDDHVLAEALDAKDDRVRLATHLLLYTGQRIGDVVALRWTDLKDDHLTLTQQKTGRRLVIPLHDALKAELIRHPKGLGYIIPGMRAGKPLHQHTLRASLQAFAAKIGAKVVPHGLRKNAVNALLEAGCSAAETASITGQSLGQIEHYAKGRAQGKLATAAILKWHGRK